MVGTHDGLHPMQRRKILKPKRSGHTLVLGPLKNLQSSKALKGIKVLLSRIRQLITLYLPSLIRKSTIREKPL